MATYEQYGQQLQQRRKSIEDTRQQLSSQKLRFTSRQLREGLDRVKKQQALAGFTQRKKAAQEKLGEEFIRQEQLEKDFAPKLASYNKAKVEASEWAEARSLVKRGSRFEGTASLREKVKVLREGGMMSAESSVESTQYNLMERKANVARLLAAGEKVDYHKTTYDIAEIDSKVFDGKFTPEEYMEKVDEYNTELERKKAINIPINVQEDIERNILMGAEEMARQKGTTVEHARKQIESYKEMYGTYGLEPEKPPELKPWNKDDKSGWSAYAYEPPKKPDGKYTPEINKALGIGLGLSSLPYIAPTIIAAPVIKKIIDSPPTSTNLDLHKDYSYKPPKKPDSPLWPAPTSANLDLHKDYSYKDIERPPASPWVAPTGTNLDLHKDYSYKPPKRPDSPLWPAPTGTNLDLHKDYSYKDIDRPPASPWPAPTSANLDLHKDYSYKDIERPKGKYTSKINKALGIGLGLSVSTYFAPSIIAAPYIKKVIDSPPTSTMPTYKYNNWVTEGYKDTDSQSFIKKEDTGMILPGTTGIGTPQDLVSQEMYTQRQQEEAGKRLLKAREEVYADFTPEKRLAFKKKWGVGVYFTYDKKLGDAEQTITLSSKQPGWFEKLRPGFEKKTQPETYIGYSFRKLRGQYSETYSDIFQRTAYKDQLSLFTAEGRRTMGKLDLTPLSKGVGTGVAIGAQIGLVGAAGPLIPGLTPLIFTGSTIEAATRGPKKFIQYAKEEPWEVGMAATYGGIKLYKYAKESIPFAKGFAFGPPKETVTYYKESALIPKADYLKAGISVKGTKNYIPSARYALQQKFEPAAFVNIYKPRYAKWLEPFGIIKEGTIGIQKVSPQTRSVLTNWFPMSGIHTAAESVGGRTIPNYYQVKKLPSSILIGGKAGIIRAPIPGVKIIEQAKWKPLTIDIKPQLNTVDIKLDSYDPIKFAAKGKYKEIKFLETDHYKVIKETGVINRITPGGTMVSGSRSYQALNIVYKNPVRLPTVGYEITPTDTGAVSARVMESIKTGGEISRPYTWLGSEVEGLGQALGKSQLTGASLSSGDVGKLVSLTKTKVVQQIPVLTKTSVTTPIIKSTSTVLDTTLTSTKVIQESLQIPLQMSSQISTTLPTQSPVQLSTQIPIQTSIQTQTPIQSSLQIPIQTPIQIPIQTPIQIPIQTPKQVPTKVPVKIPVISFPFPPKSGGGTPGKGITSKKLKGAFEVLIKRGGKWKIISKKPLPKGKALKLGTERVTKTLAATFKIRRKGITTQRDVKFKPGIKFRKPKSGEKLTFVERKQYRLKKGTSELPEILQIRGSKTKQKRSRRSGTWF